MSKLLSVLLVVPLVAAGQDLVPPTADSPTPLRSCILEPQPLPAFPVARAWSLEWDDSLDGELEAVGKRCRLHLDVIDGTVTGRFEGPVMGSVRTATFTGELIGAGAGNLLLLQQREPGYVCSYQLSRTDAERWHGTWRDSRGGTGTVMLGPEVSARLTPSTSPPARRTTSRL